MIVSLHENRMKSPKHVTITLCSSEVTVSFRGQNQTQFFSGVLGKAFELPPIVPQSSSRFAFASQKKCVEYDEQERE